MFVNKLSRRYAITVSLVCIVVAFIATLATYQITAQAGSISWVSGGELKLLSSAERSLDLQPQRCRIQKVLINDRTGLNYFDQSGFTTACIYDMGSWRYALTNRTYKGTFFNRNDESFTLSIGADTKMYRVDNLHPQDAPVYIPYSKGLVYTNEGFGWGRKLNIYKNIVKRLVKVDADSYVVTNIESPDFTFKRPNGNLLAVGATTSSDNGKWMVFQAVDLGIMRLNLETYEVKRISSVAPRYGVGANPHMSLTISNNGEYLAIAGENTPFDIYNITPDCGDDIITDELTKDVLVGRPCSVRHVGEYLDTILPSGLAAATSLRLSPDASEIGFIARLNNDRSGQNQKEYVIQAPGYTTTPKLDYLAMGDSYSSGEGDTQVVQGNKFYLSGTDVEGDSQTPREKCHVSNRSYPFLLKNKMGLTDASMKSVACSGAEVDWDYIATNDYRGQNWDGSPRLNKLLPNSLNAYQEAARANFIPGRVQQVEFADKYRPDSITFTGGGNDVGFGEVILNCLAGLATCSEAQSDEGRARIGKGIQSQHDELYKMYNSIKLKSPQSKVYAVGYPQFVDDKAHFCAPNVQLDSSERKLIMEAVRFLNDVIKDAATNAGVKYIDIEDSLVGHRLCESGKSFVTGIALWGKSERQESFHPDHNGHRLIADAFSRALGGKTVLNYVNNQSDQVDSRNAYNVETPTYFKAAMDAVSQRYKREKLVDRSYIQKKKNFTISADNLSPSSEVSIELHSDPVNLGVYAVDDAGHLSVNVTTPDDVAPGFHTLHVIAQTYSGEAIDLWQNIELRGKDDDIDEDGIKDAIDACVYVMESNIDLDKDGIDDACDPMIDEYENRETRGIFNAPNIESQIKTTEVDAIGGDHSNEAVMSTQRQIEDLFYIPDSIDDNHQLNTKKSYVGPLSIVVALIISGLILNLMIKRYSNHKEM